MSRRQMIHPDDSLELLLDTICNTFGAVIFISILASVLVQNSAADNEASSVYDKAVKQTQTQHRELSELRQRQELLKTLLTNQQELIQRFSSSESITLASLIHADTAAQAAAVALKTEAVQSTVSSENERLLIETVLQEQLTRLQQASLEQAEAEQRVRDLETQQGKTAQIRRVHETSKFGFTFALDNGRLYAVHSSDAARPDVMDLMINREDCDVVEEGGRSIIRPRKDAGLPMRDAASAAADAKVKLQPVSKAFVVRLFVARDSFAEFLPIKEALVNLDLEYSLEILPGDDVELFLTDKPQDKSYAQ